MSDRIQKSLDVLSERICQYPVQIENLKKLKVFLKDSEIKLQGLQFEGSRVGRHKGIALLFSDVEDEDNALQIEFVFASQNSLPIIYGLSNDIDAEEIEIKPQRKKLRAELFVSTDHSITETDNSRNSQKIDSFCVAA